MERSSRAPNAPPTPPSVIRTLSGGRPRLAATWSRSTCSHWVETKRSTPPSSAGTARPGLGAEERLVLHPDLVFAGDHDLGGRVRVAVLDVDVPQQVAGRVQRLGVECALGIGDRRQRLESTSIVAAARRAVSGWSAATIAIGSPW